MKHNIRTFAAIFGPKNIALLGTGMLFVNYMVPIVAAIYMPHAFKRHVILPAHSILILLLFSQFKKLEKANYTKEASTTFHTFLWKLLIFEFLLIPFI
ncbi:homogentisate solanesyltransferase, chloroplastic-like [Morus notabilis]|uniref:homogentisate solanesyltransferase, chloroplastic-like n=1 Tax=Morus notabilis TaxID=981085 RepID=UPI000CED22C1|nr:homogentisate solanesyltransferase, chloroplastic-like [Morus notabilis]